MTVETSEPLIMFGVNLQPPVAFDFANPAAWPRTAQPLRRRTSQDMQVLRSLLYYTGPEARSLLGTIALGAAFLASYALAAARSTDYFVRPANQIYESSRFHRRVQLPDESVDGF
ncbi:hypothetical protein HPB50_019962 [Hyalomma asiaticum]|uniref:Uncharacterized protein n=1 Tax=Hyalomma asiaticum TaxID=266040 RepID=A0ACB7T2I9_HYAAI|nr:hypothetical protein HPB50_019962 [Hyalomma asiaticum]